MPKTMPLRKLPPLFVPLALSASGHAFFTITFPTLGRTFGIPDLQTSIVLSVSALVLTFSAPFWGVACESRGRRTVLLCGVVGTGLCMLLLGGVIESGKLQLLASHALFYGILTIRLCHAALSAGLMPSAQAVVADVTTSTTRARGMGLLGASFGVGTLLGGALAMLTGSRWAGAGYGLISAGLALAAFIVRRYLPETKPETRPESFGAQARGGEAAATPCERRGLQIPSRQSVALWKAIAPCLLITLLGLTVYSLVQQVTAWRLQDSFQFTPHESVKFTGFIMMTSMAAMSFSQVVIVAPCSRYPLTLLRYGGLLAGVSMALASLAPSAHSLLLAMLALGLALGALMPGNLALMSLAVGQHQQGTAAGINGMAKGLGMALGPVIGAGLHSVSPRSPYLMGAIAFGAIVTLSLFTHRAMLPEGKPR